jgi:hypothetical protein
LYTLQKLDRLEKETCKRHFHKETKSELRRRRRRRRTGPAVQLHTGDKKGSIRENLPTQDRTGDPEIARYIPLQSRALNQTELWREGYHNET